MIKEFYVVMTETHTVTYLVEAENKEQAEEKVQLGDYSRQLTNSPEEMQCLEIEEVSN